MSSLLSRTDPAAACGGRARSRGTEEPCIGTGAVRLHPLPHHPLPQPLGCSPSPSPLPRLQRLLAGAWGEVKPSC